MADSFFGGKSPIVYIFLLLYCLCPAIAMLVGAAAVPNPWIALIGIHLVLMIIVPWVLHKIWPGHVSILHTIVHGNPILLRLQW